MPVHTADPLSSDPYVALGLSKDADGAEIKTAYRKLALKFHPDKNPDKSDEFHGIQQAYELIGEGEARRKYHDQLRFAELKENISLRKDGISPSGLRKKNKHRPTHEAFPYDDSLGRPERTSFSFSEPFIPSQSRKGPDPVHRQEANFYSYSTSFRSPRSGARSDKRKTNIESQPSSSGFNIKNDGMRREEHVNLASAEAYQQQAKVHPALIAFIHNDPDLGLIKAEDGKGYHISQYRLDEQMEIWNRYHGPKEVEPDRYHQPNFPSPFISSFPREETYELRSPPKANLKPVKGQSSSKHKSKKVSSSERFASGMAKMMFS